MKFIAGFAILPPRQTHVVHTAWVASSSLRLPPAATARRHVETATNQFPANGNASLPDGSRRELKKPLSHQNHYRRQFEKNTYPHGDTSEKVRSAFSDTSDSMPFSSNTDGEVSAADDNSGTSVVSEKSVEWLSRQPFPPEVAAVLQAPLHFDEPASKPIGTGMPPVPYLPEIKYRRILNKAFGPGAWALLPAGPVKREGNMIYRDYQMFVFGCLVSEARGQQSHAKGRSTDAAVEGIKSNALMRCCKDLGVASELWDPDWIKEWQSRQPARSARF